MTNKVGTVTLRKIETLLASPARVFTVGDLAVAWRVPDEVSLYSNIHYYIRTGRLRSVYKGVYALGDYTAVELGQKLVTPSYVSFYTALAAHGIVFQHYEEIHLMARISKRMTVDGIPFVYHALKGPIFFDQTGIEDRGTYMMAGPERAMCDSLYLVPGLGFDSLLGVDMERLKKTAQLYQNKRLTRDIARLIREKENHAR